MNPAAASFVLNSPIQCDSRIASFLFLEIASVIGVSKKPGKTTLNLKPVQLCLSANSCTSPNSAAFAVP